MAYPTVYTWPIVPPTASAPGDLPNPGPPVFAGPQYQDPRKKQFERGIKFGNVPDGRSELLPHTDRRVWHVNTVSNVIQSPCDKPDLGGVVKFRHRPRFANKIPDSVNLPYYQSADRFGNPIFDFTGQYPPGHEFVTIDDGFWTVQSFFAQGGRGRYVLKHMLDNAVILAGGFGSNGPMSGAMIFQSASNAWIPIPDMPTPKSWAAGTTLVSGDLFILGGSGSIGAEGRTGYRYVTGSNAWLPLTASICSRKNFQVVTLADGRVFVPGGTGLSGSTPFTGSEIFEPDSNTWFVAPAVAPRIPLYPFDREGYTLTLLEDGTALLIGGKDPRDLKPYDHVLRFWPNDKTVPGSTGSWTIEQSMSFPRYDHQTVMLDDGRVMIMGGKGGPESNLRGFLPLYLGGQFGSEVAIAQVEIYDPVVRTITPVGQMRKARANFAASILYLDAAEGRVIVCGGEDNGVTLSGAEICDVEFLSWHEITSLQTAVSHQQMIPINNPTFQKPYRFLVPSGERSGSLTPFSGSQVIQTEG